MVAGLLNGVEHIIILDDVSAPRPLADIYTSTRSVIDTVVAYGNVTAHRQLDGCNLFLIQTDIMYKIVIHKTTGGIIISLRSVGMVDAVKWDGLVIFERRRAYGIGIADKTYAAGSHTRDVGRADSRITVEVRYEYGIPSEIMQITVVDDTVPGILKQYRTAAIDCPIRA